MSQDEQQREDSKSPSGVQSEDSCSNRPSKELLSIHVNKVPWAWRGREPAKSEDSRDEKSKIKKKKYRSKETLVTKRQIAWKVLGFLHILGVEDEELPINWPMVGDVASIRALIDKQHRDKARIIHSDPSLTENVADQFNAITEARDELYALTTVAELEESWKKALGQPLRSGGSERDGSMEMPMEPLGKMLYDEDKSSDEKLHSYGESDNEIDQTGHESQQSYTEPDSKGSSSEISHDDFR